MSSTKKIDTLRAYQRAVKIAERRQKAADSAAQTIQDAKEAHIQAMPLSESQKAAVIAAFAAGKSLCCNTAEETLAACGLDCVWIDTVRGWVYEHLECNGFYQPGGRRYEDSLSRLKEFLLELK